MKKTLLAVTMLSALSLSGVANAFTEATDGNFTGKIDFNGTITDDNPTWSWEVPAESANLTGWDVLVINGTVSGDNTSFAFTKPAMTLIHGFMKTPSAIGGAGITPVIKMGPTASALTLSGDAKQTVTVVATGKNASSVAVTDGTMQVSAQAFLGGALKSGSTVKYFGSTKAQTVLRTNQSNFATLYPNPQAGTNTFTQTEALFTNAAMTDLSGAYTAEISDYKLTFPSATLPATWSAIIPVTVTLK